MGRAPRNPEWTPRAAVPVPCMRPTLSTQGWRGLLGVGPQQPAPSRLPPARPGPTPSGCPGSPTSHLSPRVRASQRGAAASPGAGLGPHAARRRRGQWRLPQVQEGTGRPCPGIRRAGCNSSRACPHPGLPQVGPGLALIPASVPSRPAPHAASGSWFRCPMHTHCPGRPGVGLGSVPRPRGAAESGGRCQAPAGAAGTGAAGSLPGTQGAHGSPRLLTHALQGGARPRPPEQMCRAGQRPLKGVGA